MSTSLATNETDVQVARAWLASVLAGKNPTCLDFTPSPDFLLKQACAHDVLSMIVWRLRSIPALREWGRFCDDSICAMSSILKSEAMVSMLLEREALCVLKQAREAEQPLLLLKGSALSHWAYQFPSLRRSADVDVLLQSRAEAEVLAAKLQQLGYERLTTSGDLVAYELMCRNHISPDLVLEVDVHWRLSNSPLFADVFTFEELWAQSVPIPKMGPNARGLGLVHACIHACVHRALNLSVGVEDKLKWLYDIEVLVCLFEDRHWSELTRVAKAKSLCGIIQEAFEKAAHTFDRVLPTGVVKDLSAVKHGGTLNASRLSDWCYMQQMTYRSLPSVKLRIIWLWQRIFPSRDYMVYLYGKNNAYLGLLQTRLQRALGRFFKKSAK